MCPFKPRFDHGGRQGNGVHDKVIRVLQIAWRLQRRDCTVDDLAARFGVSRRTIYRYLKLIDEADLPLVSQQMGKGYRVMALPSYRNGGPALGRWS